MPAHHRGSARATRSEAVGMLVYELNRLPGLIDAQTASVLSGAPDWTDFLDMVRYWRSKAADGELPRKQAIDPVELPPECLRNVIILEHDATRDDFLYRLSGTAIVDKVGVELTGRYVAEHLKFDPEYRDFLVGLFRGAIDTGVGTFTLSQYRAADHRQPNGYAGRLLLPLCGADGRIAFILGYQRFLQSDPNATLNPLGRAHQEICRFDIALDDAPPAA